MQCSVFMMDRINTRHAIRVCVCCRNAIETTSEILYSRLTAICARNCGPVAIDIYIYAVVMMVKVVMFGLIFRPTKTSHHPETSSEGEIRIRRL